MDRKLENGGKKRKDVTKWVKPCRIRLHNEWRIIIFISINWSVLNISHLSHISWHHVTKKTHVPQIASLKPVNENAIFWTWNVLMLCFWWISCRCDGKNLLTPLLLAKSFHFSNMVDYFLCLMLYYERLQTSIQPSWSWHGFMATCLWSWIPLWTMLNQIVGISHTWNLEKVNFRTRNPHAQGGRIAVASGE
jgi:hypothetical protein